MFEELLNLKVQKFISENIDNDIKKLALSKNPFPHIDWKLILNQIESKKKSKSKLPTWFNSNDILYPKTISIEQTSSETAASYKSKLVNGKTLVDASGGFGIDSYYFSNSINKVYHCELNNELSEIVNHNFTVLKKNNIQCINMNSTEFIQNEINFDWIYVDPSRRNDKKGKVFLLSDCEPNVPELIDLYFSKTKHIMIKTAPLLDIAAGLSELNCVKEIHIIAIDNEVKELLWILENGYKKDINIITVNINKEQIQQDIFNFNSNGNVHYSCPLKFLFEPNSAIYKSGLYNQICTLYNLKKIAPNSHIFTSNEIIKNFPGRKFKIENQILYNKENIKKYLEKTKMNITIRNFPLTVDELRKKHKIIDGGNIYSFFTTNINNEKIVLICTKIES